MDYGYDFGGRYESGSHVQHACDPLRFGIVTEGLHEARWSRIDKPTDERLRRHGYVLRVRWGTDAFVTEPMERFGDGEKAIHVKDLRPANPWQAGLLSQMTEGRLDQLLRASRGPVMPRGGFFGSHEQHRDLTDCEERGWLTRVGGDCWQGFALTDAGRTVVNALERSRV